MTDDFDFYDLLDVPPDASQEEIKQAFRTQVRIYHPDLNDDDRAQAQFTALKKAYDILGDPVERRAYDRLGHEDYVAKRTKGLPSPDLWKTTDETTAAGDATDDGTSGDESTATGTETTSSSRSSRAADSNPGTGSTATSTSARGSTSSRGRRTRTRTRATGSTDGGTTTATDTVRDTGTHTGSRITAGADNAFLRWWRDQNFAWPLIWIAALTYLAGLVHFAIANGSSLRTLANELGAVGADPTALWTTLSSGRHGLETPLEFVAGVELVAPPLARLQWYAALAGLVVLALVAVLGARVAWRLDTWGPVTIDETIVVALALSVSSVLVGGPLLAGAVLMPLLFGVIVYRTRQLPGWSPSVLFVVAVCTPLLALAAAAAGYTTLPSDFLAYVLVPLAGAFGLPLRASIRKRFGR